ncbi:carboxymuconolactone decarboxylase family protein [Dethiobacter alkaliphilus]|uniref:Alkylhydroperoxidase like protein, AhpD family n=1 Tax=Dethiobacter alkaliphilus AHT 1 TaxID=555088 RepID=C0GJ70_DETAL|nr:carboxymuconolactone decarboxylase family protein [Dethiobacter alkaliphilus]EEG76555.1 alkylhydroperoxidase like protein, AhpD family [Dethiobacter alkaliphilus AHT 1]MCW3489056.1 carboxymuconolactone decarboxylase family protein [Dethiobacter alkaliphilus]
MTLNTLKKLEENQKKIAGVLPEAMANFKAFHDAALKDGVLPAREKILIGLAIAVSKQCSYCIVKYVNTAMEAGISLEEMIEACGVVILMNGGPGAAYTSLVLEAYEDLS